MTAEVGVMNRLGIALAADSAVTLGKGIEKVYTSAEKLFHLAERAPVGLMVYGSANYVGMPWETIVKSYRRRLGPRTFETVAEYAEDLIRFLRANRRLFPATSQKAEIRRIVAHLYLHTRERIKKCLKDRKSPGKKLTVEDIKAAVTEAVDYEAVEIRKSSMDVGVPKTLRPRLRKKCRPDFVALQKEVFRDLPMALGKKRALTTLAVEQLLGGRFGPMRSGLVVAGFGEKEYTPAVVSLVIEGMVENRPRYHVSKTRGVSDDSSAAVMSFAQGEMVVTFMEGIDRDLRSLMEKSTDKLFRGVFEEIVSVARKVDEGIGKHLASVFRRKVDAIVQQLFDTWKEASRRAYAAPIVEVVAALPKDELAAMAEALVNLTKFKRRVSPVAETVGGPIDVAVITKGDGFVWVKRKHYFDPALNPRAMAKYGSGGG